MELRPFQRRFLKAADRPDIDTAVLSLPRGNGKSWLAARIAARALPKLERSQEIVLCGASIEQCRIVFRFARSMLGEAGYRYLDSATRCGITDLRTGGRLRVQGSNSKTAMGLVNVPLVIADEPGAWEVRGGELMADAIDTAQGKPGSPLKAVYIGTLAPATGGWWHALIDGGSGGSTYVQALQGDPAKWDHWSEIRRCNPLTAVSADFRRKLLEERDEARGDSRLKARFLSYRLNVPTADESTMLLTVPEWKRVCARAVPGRVGRPIVGIDLGAGRAWSAAVALWRSGRAEAVAIAPGLPGLAEQERRDRVPSGVYQRLAAAGVLKVAEGLRVPPPALLWKFIRETWGQPWVIVCDRFRLGELQDAVGGAVQVLPRRTRWSEAAADIRALRKMALDGPLGVPAEAQALLTASLSAARVVNDDQGSVRLSKRGTNNEARDDVAAALVLGAGAWSRAPSAPRLVRSAIVG